MSEASAKAFITDPAGSTSAEDVRDAIGVIYTDLAAKPEWAAYVPTWTADSVNPSLGDGTLEGRYAQIGDVVHVEIELTIGSSTTLGTGIWSFSLPVTARSGAARRTGTAMVLDGGAFMIGICKPRTQTTINAIIVDPTDSDKYSLEATSSYPIGWAQDDQLNMAITYEAA